MKASDCLTSAQVAQRNINLTAHKVAGVWRKNLDQDLYERGLDPGEPTGFCVGGTYYEVDTPGVKEAVQVLADQLMSDGYVGVNIRIEQPAARPSRSSWYTWLFGASEKTHCEKYPLMWVYLQRPEVS